MRRKRKQKRAPEAPKKAMTAYIFFNKEMRQQVKESLGPTAKTTEIVRVIAEKWSNMTDEEKAPYVKMAEDDKVRYNREISNYEGPLHVPVTRKRGHQNRSPDAPKRAMSPFLYFSNEKRQEMQKCNPDLKVTDISAKLGEIWRDMTDEQKEPYVKKSAADRDRYHKEQEVFKSKNSKPDNPEEKTPTPTVNPPVQTVVTPNQWNVQMNENSTNPLYSRPYDISNQLDLAVSYGSCV